ncbi:hypothetical protein [Aeromonas veronii]
MLNQYLYINEGGWVRYYIYAPSYDENSGGSIVLHRFCHLLNSIDGCEAYLVPRVPERLSITKTSSFFKDLLRAIKWVLTLNCFKLQFKVHKDWDTPVILKWEIADIDSSVVVYPEITYGNPLNAKNVVRWFLHQPGYFTGQVNFGVNELHFRFSSMVKDFNHCLSTLSENYLTVIYYPLEYYNMNGATNKEGCCHLFRKGKGKKECHPSSSIQLDGLSHKQISDIFKNSKTFISYDDYTAYSYFAVLCGCDSVVVPQEGVSKEQWHPNQADRYGLAYGFSERELNLAKQTKSKVLEYILGEHQRSFDNVNKFVEETKNFFQNIEVKSG